MNTHDIELPPLPDWADRTLQGEDRDSLFAWAEAAIEADRKRQGDSAKVLAELVALIPLADTLNASASCQDLIDYFKGVIADRKRRGEPVGIVKRPSESHFPGVQWLGDVRDGEHLYTTPHPAEPVRGEPVAWPADIMLAAEMALEDAEDGESPTLEIHASRIVEALSAPQPAEPVKCIGCEGKPAPENNPCAVCGKEAEPVKSYLTVKYDDKGDCLYVCCDSNEPAEAEESEQGVLLRRAFSDGRLVGVTIPNFMGRYEKPVKVPSMRDLIADDAYAATFQSVGQYRKALLARYTTTKEQP